MLATTRNYAFLLQEALQAPLIANRKGIPSDPDYSTSPDAHPDVFLNPIRRSAYPCFRVLDHH